MERKIKHSEEVSMYQYMVKDQQIQCEKKCEQTSNTISCKLRIFNGTCPVKSLKENYRTGYYDVVDELSLD